MLALDEVAADGAGFREAVTAAEPYRPVYVKIKLTWHCNLRCRMCNVWRQSRDDRLTLPVIHSLADDLAGLGTDKVHLSGGEVLLRPDLCAVIKAFAGRGMQVNLTTNGTLLTQERAERLAATGLRNVSISLDGATPGVHDGLRGKGNWRRTIRGIHNLRRAAKHADRKLHIRVNYVITRRNFHDLAGLPEIVRQAGADRLTLIPVDDSSGRLRLNKERIQMYNEEIAPILAGQALAYGLIGRVEEAYPFGRTKAEVEISKIGGYALGTYAAQPCYMPWVHAMIDPEGRVYACCMLRTTRRLGTLFKPGGFRAVWEGAAFADFRRRMLEAEGRPAACHACDDFIDENRFLHAVCQV